LELNFEHQIASLLPERKDSKNIQIYNTTLSNDSEQKKKTMMTLTCIKSEEVLAQNSVEKDGHVSDDPHHMGVRKSTQLRRENILLKDFTHFRTLGV